MIAHIFGRRSSGFHDVTREAATIVEALLPTPGLLGAEKPLGVDLTLRLGVVVGVAGLLGSGCSARVLCGIQPKAGGKIYIKGGPVAIAKPRDAIDAGSTLVPENRARWGFVAFTPSSRTSTCRTSTGCRRRSGSIAARRRRWPRPRSSA